LAGAKVLLMEFFRYLILRNGVVEILRGANRAPLRVNALVVLIALLCLSRMLCLPSEWKRNS
jgi:hypothetical protein